MTDQPNPRTCCVPLYTNWLPCPDPAFADLPCCYNHVWRWTLDSRENLLAFLTPRVHRIAVVAAVGSRRRVSLLVLRRLGPSIVPCTLTAQQSGGTELLLDPETAAIVADLLRDRGAELAATLTLLALERCAKPRVETF